MVFFACASDGGVLQLHASARAVHFRAFVAPLVPSAAAPPGDTFVEDTKSAEAEPLWRQFTAVSSQVAIKVEDVGDDSKLSEAVSGPPSAALYAVVPFPRSARSYGTAGSSLPALCVQGRRGKLLAAAASDAVDSAPRAAEPAGAGEEGKAAPGSISDRRDAATFLEMCDQCFPATVRKRDARGMMASSSESDSDSDSDSDSSSDAKTGRRDVKGDTGASGAGDVTPGGTLTCSLPLRADSLEELAHAVPLDAGLLAELRAHYGVTGFGFLIVQVVPPSNSGRSKKASDAGLVGGYKGSSGGTRLVGVAGGGAMPGEQVVGDVTFALAHDRPHRDWLFVPTRAPCAAAKHHAGDKGASDDRSTSLPSTDLEGPAAVMHPAGAYPDHDASAAAAKAHIAKTGRLPDKVQLPVGDAVGDMCEEAEDPWDHTIYSLGGQRRSDWAGAGKSPAVMNDEMRRRFASGSLNRITPPAVAFKSAKRRLPLASPSRMGGALLSNRAQGARERPTAEASESAPIHPPVKRSTSWFAAVGKRLRKEFPASKPEPRDGETYEAASAAPTVEAVSIKRRRIVARPPNHDVCIALDPAAGSATA